MPVHMAFLNLLPLEGELQLHQCTYQLAIKTDMHKLCVSTLQECEPPHTLGYTSFRKIWKRYVPDVRVMTPRTDVCANCDRLRGEVARAKTEEQTVAAMAALTAHTASRA